jgi:phosphoesterase RecJ-like protein
MNKYIELMNKIKEYDSIIVFGHTSPDGDCYGSQMGLKKFINHQFPNKKVYIVGSGFAKAIPFFGPMDNVDDKIISTSLAVLVDCSDLERVEDPRITKCQEIVKIDHHLGSDEQTYASVNIYDFYSSSACQMVAELVLENGYNLTLDVAEPLFMGIVTDSGRFQYLSSCKGMFNVLEIMMETGVDFQKIFDFLYEGDEKNTRIKGYISYNFKTDGGIAYIILDKNTLKELGTDYNSVSMHVNCLSSMKGYPIWVTFAESDEGLIRVELRSKIYNVQQVATLFGGGGHQKASGCRLHSIGECYQLISELKKIIKG